MNALEFQLNAYQEGVVSFQSCGGLVRHGRHIILTWCREEIDVCPKRLQDLALSDY